MPSKGIAKNPKTGSTTMALPKRKSPMGQVLLVGAVCFCCPGMFSALTGMGGGGQVDPHAANTSLTALYLAFAVFGLLGGGFNNILGPRLTVLLGSLFYALYSASFLAYNHTHNELLVVIAGGLLGFGAGLLWSGQGAILMSYPPAGSKGVYIAVFWSVFNMGGVVGGLIPLVLNFNNDQSTSVNDSTYIAFVAFMLIGSILSLGIVSPDQVVRQEDEERVQMMSETAEETSISKEIHELLNLFKDRHMLVFIPACIASNFFYTYHFNCVNAPLFNVRTRGLNNVIYWASQMLGSVVIGKILDNGVPSRRYKGSIGILVVVTVCTLIWGGAFANQRHYTRHKLPDSPIDFTDGSSFVKPFVLYACFGLMGAMYQTLCYWIMGESSRDVLMLSRYAGFYKGLQSLGAAVAWQLDAKRMSFMAQLLVNWVLMTVSFPLLWVMVKRFE